MTTVRDYQQTHQKLLKSGLQHFLTQDFAKVSVRQICQDAGVTTGAFYKHFSGKEALLDELLSPYLTHLKQMYQQKIANFSNQLNQDNMAKYWKNQSDEMSDYLDYMYQNPELTHIILFNTSNSKYDHLLEDFTLLAEKQTLLLIQKTQRVKQASLEPAESLHFFVYSFYATIYDILRHCYSLQKSKALAQRLYLFLTPAWLNLLGH